MKAKDSADKSRILLILIFLIVGGTFAYILTQLRTDPIVQSVNRKEVLGGALVITKDKLPFFNQVVFIQPETLKTAMIDIPPETGSFLPDLKRYDSIDSLFDTANPQIYIQKLEETIGQSLQFYLIMDLDGLSKIIDLVSGLEVFISNSLESIKEEPFTLLPSGTSILDGKKIVDYLTFNEEGESSTEKIGRHQKLVQALLRKWSDQREVLTHPTSLPFFHSFMRTNLDELALGSFVDLVGESDLERMVFLRVMGDIRRVDEKRLLFPHSNGNLLKQTVVQMVQNLSSSEVLPNMGTAVVLEILNGTATNGLAGRTAQLFESHNYKISTVKNADTLDIEKTVVIDRKGNLGVAQRVADVIRCAQILSGEEYLDDSIHEVTIIIGKDFNGTIVTND